MTDYRHNWRDGYHPLLAVPSGIRPWGMDVPALGPVQGGGTWAPCQTQVIEWPWSEDELGVEFDQENLWGVRTRCWSIDDIGDPGDRDWWVAVPKTLGGDYTPRGRSHVQPMIYDHLGDNPFYGVVTDDGFGGYTTRPVRWRTPTGQYPSDLSDDGYLWVPMNLNQRYLEVYNIVGGSLGFGYTEACNSGVATGFDGPGCSIGYTAGPNLFRDWGYSQIGRHVGFRGGKIILRLFSNRACPLAASETAGDMRIVIGWDDTTPSTTALPPNIEFDDSYTISDLSSVGGGTWYGIYYSQRFEAIIDLPAMLIPEAEAEPKYWIAFVGPCMAGYNFSLDSLSLSPRTDIPLWYWSSQRNRVAPGGIILP